MNMKKIGAAILIICLAVYSCNKGQDGRRGICGKSAQSDYQKGMLALNKNDKSGAEKYFLKAILSCGHPEAQIEFAGIQLREGKYKEAKKNYLIALYTYNKSITAQSELIIREKIANLFYKLALLEARQERKEQSLAFLWEAVQTGLKSKHLIFTNRSLGILRGEAELKLLLENFEKAVSNRKIMTVKYFSYFEGYNPLKLIEEINSADYAQLMNIKADTLEKRKLLMKNKIKPLSGLVYKVHYGENNKAVFMEIFRLGRNFTPHQKMMTYYFDSLERLERIIDLNPDRKNWGTVSDYFYAGETTRIVKIVRKIKFFPFYIEKILIEHYSAYNF